MRRGTSACEVRSPRRYPRNDLDVQVHHFRAVPPKRRDRPPGHSYRGPAYPDFIGHVGQGNKFVAELPDRFIKVFLCNLIEVKTENRLIALKKFAKLIVADERDSKSGYAIVTRTAPIARDATRLVRD